MQVQIAKITISTENKHHGNKTTLGYLNLLFKTKKKTSQDLGQGSGRFNSFQPKIPELSETGCGGEGNGTNILWENINFRMAHISNPNWKNTVKKFRLLNKKFPVSTVIFLKFVYSLRGWMSSVSETLCKRKDRILGPIDLAFLRRKISKWQN